MTQCPLCGGEPKHDSRAMTYQCPDTECLMSGSPTSEVRWEALATLRVQRDEAVALAQKATLEFGTLAVEHAKQANERAFPNYYTERATGVPEALEYVFECSCDDGDTRKCSHRPHDGGPCECSCHKDPPGVPEATDSRKTVDIGRMLAALDAMNPSTGVPEARKCGEFNAQEGVYCELSHGHSTGHMGKASGRSACCWVKVSNRSDAGSARGGTAGEGGRQMRAPEPCPYCGVKVDLYPETRNLGIQVECANCGVRGPFKPTMEEAVEAFDRMRPPAAPPVAEADGQRRHWTEKRTTSIDPDYRREPKTDLFCCRCQKDIAGETGIKGVHLCSDALHMAIHPEDAGPSDDIHPLGAECARKIPREYIVDFKWSATTAAQPVAEDADADGAVEAFEKAVREHAIAACAHNDHAGYARRMDAARNAVRARMRPPITAEGMWDALANAGAGLPTLRIKGERIKLVLVTMDNVRAALAALGGGK